MSNLDEQELRAYMNAQLEEINNFIWDLGVTMQRDPRDFFSREELARIWIDRYAKKFHDEWFNAK